MYYNRLKFSGVHALYRDFHRELEWTMRAHMMDVGQLNYLTTLFE